MFGKKNDGFKPGELEKMVDKISKKQEKERKRFSGLSNEQYGQYEMFKDQLTTAKNALKYLKKNK